MGPNAERVAIIDVEWSTTGHKSLNVEVVNTDIQSQEHGFSIHKGVRDHDNEGGHYDMDGFSIDSHNHIARDKNFKFQVRLPTPPEKKKPVSTTEFNEMRENLKRLETEKHNMKAEMEAKLADQIKTMEAGIHEKIMRQITQQIMAGGIVDKVDSRSNAQTPLPRIHEGEDKSRNQDQSQNQNPSSTRDRGTQGLEGTSVDARELQTGRSTSSKGNGHKSSRSHQSRRRSSKKQRTRLSVASVPKELRCLGCDATDEAVLFTCTKCPRGMHPNFCIKKTCWHSKHPKEVSRMNECHNCTKQLDVTAHKESLSQHVGVFRCPQCKSVYYCSRECQVEHWKAGHYEECATLRLSRKDLKHKRALLPGRTRPSLPSEEEKKTLTPKEIEEMMENLYIDDAEKNLYQNLTRMKNAARGRGVTNTVLSRLQESQLKEKMKSQLAAAKRASISGTLISSTVLMSQLAATIKKGSSDSTMGDSSNRSEATTSFRPGTGSALRPSTGSVTRPETGSLARPSTGSILRPTTGSAASTDSTGSVTEGHVDTTGVDMSIATSVAKPVAGICADEEVALSADEKRRSDLKAKIANMTQEEKEKYRKLLIHERENKRREKVAQKHLRKRKSSMKDKKNKKKEIKRTASIKKRSIKKNMTTKEKKILEEAASKEAAEQDRKKQIAQRQSQRRASLSMSIEDARLEKLRKEQARKAKIKHKAENARKQAEAIIAKGMKEEQEKQDRMKIRRQSRSGRRSGAGSRSSTPSYSRGSTPAQRGSTPLTRGSTPLSARPEKMKDVNYMNGNEGRGGSNIEFIEPINEESPSDDLEEFLRLEAELVEEGQK